MLYPALVCLYTAGIAWGSAGDYETLNSLLVGMSVRHRNGEHPAAKVLHPVEIVNPDVVRRIPGMERLLFPVNEHLFRVLRLPFLSLLPSDPDYERAFDRFEYLLALVHADLAVMGETRHVWGPVGRYAYRQQILGETQKEVEAQGPEWAPLRAGLFGGSLERLQYVKTSWDGSIREKYPSLH